MPPLGAASKLVITFTVDPAPPVNTFTVDVTFMAALLVLGLATVTVKGTAVPPLVALGKNTLLLTATDFKKFVVPSNVPHQTKGTKT